jgi:hypothetical protein
LSPTVIVHEFGDDQSPINSLILRPDGTFYGTTADIYTVPDIRTIYSLKPEAGIDADRQGRSKYPPLFSQSSIVRPKSRPLKS